MLKKIILKGILLIIISVVTCLELSATARVYVNIGGPSFKKPVLAVYSKCEDMACPELKNVEDVIKSDMVRSNTFIMLPYETTPSEDQKESLLAWKVGGAEYLISLDFKSTMIRVKLIGLTMGEDIIDESVKKQTSYIDTAHEISDVIYRKLTNEPSVFRSKIAMICSTDDDKNKNLFVMDYDGRRLRQLRSYKSISISPSWSPDGKYIAYTRYVKKYYRGKGNIVNQLIYLYNVSTQKETLLADSIGQNSGVTWSPDSKSIAFTMSKQLDPDIYLMDLSSKNIKPLIKNFGLDVEPSFSPDGKFLVFSSSRSGRPELYKIELGTEIQTRLTFSKHYNSSPSWSPMGDMIAFSGLDNPFGKDGGSRFDVFLINPNGTKIERLTIDSGNNENPSWAPNGRHLVYSSTRNKGSDIYMINADGTGETKLTNGLRCYSPFWSPLVPSSM